MLIGFKSVRSPHFYTQEKVKERERKRERDAGSKASLVMSCSYSSKRAAGIFLLRNNEKKKTMMMMKMMRDFEASASSPTLTKSHSSFLFVSGEELSPLLRRVLLYSTTSKRSYRSISRKKAPVADRRIPESPRPCSVRLGF